MANPQKEDGYTPIANEIMECLYAISLSGSEYKIILCILRKTYGWRKKTDRISLSQLVDETNLSRKQVCKIIDRLVTKRLLLKGKEKNINTYEFNKDHEMWLVYDRCITSERSVTINSVQSVTKTSDRSVTYKRKERKERNYTKESKNKFLQEMEQFKKNF
jgi:phage replication O-like protein O